MIGFEEKKRSKSLMEACAVLSKMGWLSTRSEKTRALILAKARIRNFSENQPLYSAGDSANGLFGMISGGVRLYVSGRDGDHVIGHRAETGFWVGDLALFADQKRLISVVAACETKTVWIPQAALLELVQLHPDLYRDFYDLTYRNMELALQLIANLSVPETTRRLVQRFLLQDELLQTPGSWIAISQDELAEMVAVSLPTLRRILRRLTEAGLVEVGYGKFRVLNREGLMRWHLSPE